MLMFIVCCFIYFFWESTSARLKMSSERWIEFARTAFAVDPRIALSLASRFPTVSSLKAEVTQLVQVWSSWPIFFSGLLLILFLTFCTHTYKVSRMANKSI